MKRRLTVSLILTIATLSAATLASGLRELDLRKGGLPFAGAIPVENQKQFGICYAETACALLDYWNLTRNQGTQAICSPIQAGNEYSLATGRSSADGGHVCEAVEAILPTKTSCPSAALDPAQFDHLSTQFHSAIALNLLAYATGQRETPLVTREQFLNRQGLSSDQLAYIQAFMTAYVNRVVPIIVGRGFSAARLPKIDRVFLDFSANVRAKRWAAIGPTYVRSLIESSCAVPVRTVEFPKVKCQVSPLTKEGPAVLLSALKARLLAPSISPQPIAINYCVNVLNDPEYIGVLGPGALIYDCSQHSSAIVGYRTARTGDDEFLIRNSWGTQMTYAWPSQAGYIWVSGRALARNIAEFQWLEAAPAATR